MLQERQYLVGTSIASLGGAALMMVHLDTGGPRVRGSSSGAVGGNW
jgi:hypothetical protein